MNHTTHAASENSEPRRPLRADFTALTMRRAAMAKRRTLTKKQYKAFLKEPFSMKSLSFLRTAPGAALAVAIIATTSVSAYTIANWFNADVTVTQNNAILSVDLSDCKGNLPPGVTTTDTHNVQFKILGNPHISAADLQQKLLAECEYQAVVDFYKAKPVQTHLQAGTITSVEDGIVGVTYQWGGKANEKTFMLAADATVYNQGASAQVSDLKVGNTVVLATPEQSVQEGVDPLTEATHALSIFKTQYDVTQAMSESKKGFYETNKIMPLDAYNQLQKQ
jgi:hypothetical protein